MCVCVCVDCAESHGSEDHYHECYTGRWQVSALLWRSPIACECGMRAPVEYHMECNHKKKRFSLIGGGRAINCDCSFSGE